MERITKNFTLHLAFMCTNISHHPQSVHCLLLNSAALIEQRDSGRERHRINMGIIHNALYTDAQAVGACS